MKHCTKKCCYGTKWEPPIKCRADIMFKCSNVFPSYIIRIKNPWALQ